MIAGGLTDGDSGRRAHSRATRTIMEIDNKVPAGGPMIYFGPADAQGVHLPHNDALVISAAIANYTVQCIFVDSGSSADALFHKVNQQMELGDVPLEPVDTSKIYLEQLPLLHQPQSAIKAQALAEFVNEATFTEENEGNWLLHVDGSSTLAGSGAGIVLTSPEGDELEYNLHFDFKASNNEAEYETLIAGIRIALDAGARNLIAYMNSQLVTKQVEASSLVDCNTRSITIKTLVKNSLKTDIATLQIETDWRKSLLDYLMEDILPADEKKAAHFFHQQPA
ncbi:UNVERIFIED_CONTAM: hypothetical protein Slati_3798500 [Sesamum latifolium]|uniref:RNase H type-1 domain-containing protein n=1 Tax=Sesamum latifolium TaxID=2727402 RepID=A0AAW2U5K0_9LAMI